MNINKHSEYFDPRTITDPIHVIGIGAIGSTIVENLVRLGFTNIHVYDFDVVSEHNIANQIFLFEHIGILKVDAIEQIAKSINPEVKIFKHPQGCDPEEDIFEGYVFICPDNIEVRKKIIETNRFNDMIKVLFDGRMRLTDAQAYACEWNDKDIKRILKTMDFSQEEAQESTPVSACGTTLNVVYIVRLIASLITSNFVNYLRTKNLKRVILMDSETYLLEVFE